jgi:hypothetical protein
MKQVLIASVICLMASTVFSANAMAKTNKAKHERARELKEVRCPKKPL